MMADTGTARLRMAAPAPSRGDPALALALYRQAVEASPENGRALLARGDALAAGLPCRRRAA